MLFLKDKRSPDFVPADVISDDHDEETHGIRCPHCRWQPASSDRWCCIGMGTPEPPFPGCGTSWNTFDTRGKCPGCSHQWRWTLCLSCHRWSLHDAWYASGMP